MSTVELTEKRRWFLERMTQSAEQAQWGFELLLQRDDVTGYFDHLRAFGLFDPKNNPAPVPVENGKFVRVPYWPALDYLEACAKHASRSDDDALAERILDVLRNVTRARQEINGVPDNHHTHLKFAEIFGHLPPRCIGQADVDLIRIWIDSQFDRGMVAHALDKGLMKRLLESPQPEDWSKAARVLWHCTAITWVDDEGLERKQRKPVSIVDDYWLKELIDHHATSLGSKARAEAVEVFLERTREVYREETRARASWLFRPAVENHKQNHDWAGPDNRFVEGLRDALIGWIDVDHASATRCVEAMLGDQTEIVRRVALHVVNERWTVVRSVFRPFIEPRLFDSGHLHELYGLLRERFSSFTDEEKRAVVEAIRGIQPSTHWKEPEESLKRAQRNWLSAVAGKGEDSADIWYETLQQDPKIGQLSEHPDFHTYMVSWAGPGPTPFRPEQLIEFAKDGSLIQRLNAFEPKRSWRGPTTKALVDALEEAIGIAPDVFVDVMPAFIDAARPYQYGLINGFKRLWDEPKDKTSALNWHQIWPLLISLFESIVLADEFWTESVVDDRDLTPTRNWIPPVIAEFLRAGTRDDKKSYEPALLPRAWVLICRLLEKAEAADDIDKDAMTQAINTSKGKAVEALFSHALRTCRVADRTRKTHADAWTEIEPVFDSELAKCRNANFEFSTLAAAYIANIEYLSADWLRANIDGIFPAKYSGNLFGAIAGLAYAPATRSTYQLLADREVLDRALAMELGERNTRERLLERIALAYLWGDEDLTSPRVRRLFDEQRLGDLQVVGDFFWSVSNQELKPGQVQKILAFWKQCTEWSEKREPAPAQLLSHLSRLSIYVTKLGSEEVELLQAVAPHVEKAHNADQFVEQLLRLVPLDPVAVSAVFSKLLETYEPAFDYEDKLKTLVRSLAESGLKKEAIDFADRLRRLPGMPELFSELVQ